MAEDLDKADGFEPNEIVEEERLERSLVYLYSFPSVRANVPLKTDWRHEDSALELGKKWVAEGLSVTKEGELITIYYGRLKRIIYPTGPIPPVAAVAVDVASLSPNIHIAPPTGPAWLVDSAVRRS